MSKYTVIDLPIEPIEDRYSKQWAAWFPQAYARNDISFLQIYGRVAGAYEASPDLFLDPTKTFQWKFSQLTELVGQLRYYAANRELRDRTVVIFLHDFWFPGIESIKYAATMLNLDVRIVGFAHAGSYLSNDLLGIKGLHQWFRGSEQTWFKMCDYVCVGTEDHKSRILASLGQSDLDFNKVVVTGYPIEVPDLGDIERDPNLIVWPHRIAEDKHPEIFDMLSREPSLSKYKFIKTKEVCKTKEAYYRMLRMAKLSISTASMETWGIAMTESALSGCFCLTPDWLAYKETMPYKWRYNGYDQLVSETKRMMSAKFAPVYNPPCGEFSVSTVTDRICALIDKAASCK